MRANIRTEARDTTSTFSKISTGKYSREGNYLVKDQFKILIANRSNTGTNKPIQFLVLKQPEKRWISSIYPTITPFTYFFDDLKFGINYQLKLSTTTAIITLRV